MSYFLKRLIRVPLNMNGVSTFHSSFLVPSCLNCQHSPRMIEFLPVIPALFQINLRRGFSSFHLLSIGHHWSPQTAIWLGSATWPNLRAGRQVPAAGEAERKSLLAPNPVDGGSRSKSSRRKMLRRASGQTTKSGQDS